MPLAKGNRVTTAQKHTIQKIRRKRNAEPAIFFDKSVQAPQMEAIIKRLSERKARHVAESRDKSIAEVKYTILSHDEVPGVRRRSEDNPTRRVTGTQLATRVVAKELLDSVAHFNLHPGEEKIISQMLLQRPYKVPGTSIDTRKPEQVLVLELVGKVGEEKTAEIIHAVMQRAKLIGILSQEAQKSPHSLKSDIFANISHKLMTYEFIIHEEIKAKEEMVSRIDEFIQRRRAQIDLLEKLNVVDKKAFLDQLRQQQREAVLARVQFQKQHHP